MQRINLAFVLDRNMLCAVLLVLDAKKFFNQMAFIITEMTADMILARLKAEGQADDGNTLAL